LADRRYKLLKAGIPGNASFEVADLAANEFPIWNLTTTEWDKTDLDLYYTAAQVDTLIATVDTVYLGADKALESSAQGVNIYDPSGGNDPVLSFRNAAETQIALVQSFNNNLYVDNHVNSGTVVIRGSAAAPADRTMLALSPTGAHVVYIAGAISFVFNGTDAYVRSTTNTSPFFALYGSDSIRDAYWQTTASSAELVSEVHGGPWVMRAEDAGGTVRSIQLADPDNNWHGYYNGALSLFTFSQGIVVQDPTGTTPTIYFYRNTGVRNSFIASYNTTLYCRNENHGSEVRIQAEDAGGTVRDVIRADPDTYTDIYAAGYLGVRVGNATLGFFSNSGNAKQTVTGSRGGNAALASLLSVLVNHGLLTNSTT